MTLYDTVKTTHHLMQQRPAYLHSLEVEVVNVTLVQIQVLAVAFFISKIHQVCQHTATLSRCNSTQP